MSIGINIATILRLLWIIHDHCPRATMDTDDTNLGVIRISYNMGKGFVPNWRPEEIDFFNRHLNIRTYSGYVEVTT